MKTPRVYIYVCILAYSVSGISGGGGENYRKRATGKQKFVILQY